MNKREDKCKIITKIHFNRKPTSLSRKVKKFKNYKAYIIRRDITKIVIIEKPRKINNPNRRERPSSPK